jgi:2-C-methyl-D-erythritol 4-phosphate cytidylyltransferase
MRAATAKAFLDIAGAPMAVYALRTLTRVSDVKSIVLVIGTDQKAQAREIIQRFGPWSLPLRLAPGGAERQDSVAAGLAVVPTAAALVLVHDAARPFVSPACVQACIDSAATHGAAIAAVATHETVKLAGADSVIVETLDRRRIWLAQTPQVFRTGVLREAYAKAGRDGYVGTDDASLVERLGHPVRVVPGEPTNRKITTPDDLQWAEWYIQVRGSPTADSRRS